MTRAFAATIAAFLGLAVLSAPAAEACISCNYKPEVVNTPVPGAKAKKRAAKKQQTAPAKKRVVKQAPVKRRTSPPKATETAKSEAPAETTTSTATDETSEEPSSRAGTATAAFAAREAAKAEAANSAPPEVGCKRYSAQAGTTVTVPCD